MKRYMQALPSIKIVVIRSSYLFRLRSSLWNCIAGISLSTRPGGH